MIIFFKKNGFGICLRTLENFRGKKTHDVVFDVLLLPQLFIFLI